MSYKHICSVHRELYFKIVEICYPLKIIIIITVIITIITFVCCVIAGTSLQVCTQSQTCCTEDMESKLVSLSGKEYETVVDATFKFIKSTFISRTKKFDGEFCFVLYFVLHFGVACTLIDAECKPTFKNR